MRRNSNRPLTWLLACTAIGLAVAATIQSSNRSLEKLDNLATYHSPEGGQGKITLLSKSYELKDQYQSMEGPSSYTHDIKVLPATQDADKTVWLTGLDVELVTPDTTSQLSPEFFCHSNLTFSAKQGGPDSHNASFQGNTHADWRLFTLVPGRMKLALPKGFGIPVKGSTSLDNFTMALNQSQDAPSSIRMRSTLHYSSQPLTPLFRRAVYVYQKHLESTTQEQQELCITPQQSHSGEACAISLDTDQRSTLPSGFAFLESGTGQWHPGKDCCVTNASPGGVVNQFGSDHTVHWMVPTGTHQYRSEVTEQLNLPSSTSAHYVTGHLHPHGDWLRLQDLETKEVILQIDSEDFNDRWGVRTMSEITSDSGIPIEKGRRYELVTQYTNPTDTPVDVMAILYLYLREPSNITASTN